MTSCSPIIMASCDPKKIHVDSLLVSPGLLQSRPKRSPRDVNPAAIKVDAPTTLTLKNVAVKFISNRLICYSFFSSFFFFFFFFCCCDLLISMVNDGNILQSMWSVCLIDGGSPSPRDKHTEGTMLLSTHAWRQDIVAMFIPLPQVCVCAYHYDVMPCECIAFWKKSVMAYV